MEMKMVGLTGGIGSGKSLVAKIFEHLGIPTFNADKESKIVLDFDPEVRRQITQWFGSDLYRTNHLDRVGLASIIFADAGALARVNSLVHPKVLDRFLAWSQDYRQKPYVLHEAAIIFESGFYRHLDTTILVTAPEEIRTHRIISRDHLTAEAIKLRIRNQWPDEQKIPLAGFILNNDGLSPIVPEVLGIHNQLLS